MYPSFPTERSRSMGKEMEDEAEEMPDYKCLINKKCPASPDISGE